MLLGARRCRSISPARRSLRSKRAARRCSGRQTGQIDGQTDGQTLDRYIDPASHTMRAMSMNDCKQAKTNRKFISIIIIIIIIIHEYNYGGAAALLLQDHLTMSVSCFAG